MGAVVLKKKLLYEANLITHKAETFLTVNCSQSVDLCKRKCIYHCVCVSMETFITGLQLGTYHKSI